MSKKLKVGLRVIGKTKQCLGWKGIITAIVMIDAKKRFVVKFDIQGDKTVTSVAIKKDDGGAPIGVDDHDEQKSGGESDVSGDEGNPRGESDQDEEGKGEDVDEEDGY